MELAVRSSQKNGDTMNLGRIIRAVLAILVLVGALAMAEDVNNNTTRVQSTNGITSDQANAILDERRAIHQLLAHQSRPAPLPAESNLPQRSKCILDMGGTPSAPLIPRSPWG